CAGGACLDSVTRCIKFQPRVLTQGKSFSTVMAYPHLVKEDDMTIHSTSRRWALAGFAALTVAALAGCAGGDGGTTGGNTGGAKGGDEPEKFTVLTANENQALEDQLQMLADGACSEENAAMPIEHQKTAQADTTQKVTLLASQNALPQHFIAGTDMVRPTGDLGAGGLVADYKDVLGDAFDNIL